MNDRDDRLAHHVRVDLSEARVDRLWGRVSARLACALGVTATWAMMLGLGGLLLTLFGLAVAIVVASSTAPAAP